MFDIRKVFRLNKVIEDWVAAEQAQDPTLELEDILATAQRVVENHDDHDVETRCWAAAAAVVLMGMITAEREADGCEGVV